MEKTEIFNWTQLLECLLAFYIYMENEEESVAATSNATKNQSKRDVVSYGQQKGRES